jgi:formate hydrogenlyase transcriptional activator
LDEIGDLPLELQPKLLRVIQERQFERLGGAATIRTDVRVICATHRNLVEMVDERQFRADLFYRVSVFPIELPPLRDRHEDIRLLVQHFAMDYAARMHKRITAISEEFMAVVARHSWPGNVRELQNFIERSVILSTGAVLSGSLPALTQTTRDGSKWSKATAPAALEQTEGVIRSRSGAASRLGLRTLAENEREHISEILQTTNGLIAGKAGAAEVLGLPASTLRSRMKKLGIRP